MYRKREREREQETKTKECVAMMVNIQAAKEGRKTEKKKRKNNPDKTKME